MKTVILTLKLSTSERRRLTRCVAHRQEELQRLTGQHIDLSASAYLRWLDEAAFGGSSAGALRS